MTPSMRAQIITRRTYNRPLNGAGDEFETWDQTVARVLRHQDWLWRRAGGVDHSADRTAELAELGALFSARKALPAGRTLWLGGTEISRRRESSQFNCSFIRVETIHDVVDAMWLLLQGCGVGFEPVTGALNGFMRPIPAIEVVRSERNKKGGAEANAETWDAETRTWTIQVGDSAEAWAKAAGKLVAGKRPADRLVIDLSQIRPPGERLSGYGWICSGDALLARALAAVADILNRRAGELLSRLDILDILNWLGTVLSSRRSAEIALVPYGDPEWRAFATAKSDLAAQPQRAQSNNSLVFWAKPSRGELYDIFQLMLAGGGSEPGFINREAALRRAPWFSGVNPCAEVLLANKSFCNLSEIDVAAFVNDAAGLERAIWLMARANYRQTLVELEDGILQRTWHENNEFLRLCGVGLTGIARRPDITPYQYRKLHDVAVAGAYAMADELGAQRPKNVTVIKPSGTLSKIMDTTEGCHRPAGRFVFNNIAFNRDDPLLPLLRGAGYRVVEHPNDPGAMLVTFPVEWDDAPFEARNGKPVNTDGAVEQLERYRTLMNNYVDQNCSITVSYDPSEVDDIVGWLDRHWDDYVGVAWMLRLDPTKTSADLGFNYLPQEVVAEQTFRAYASELKSVDLDAAPGAGELDVEECANGACPVR